MSAEAAAGTAAPTRSRPVRGRAARVNRRSPQRHCPARGRRGLGVLAAVLGLLLVAVDLAGVHGVGERGPHGTRCLPEVLSVDGGRVVIYDTMVNVPMRRLFLIGPNKPLWVVQSVPAQQANVVTFSRTFDGRPNPDFGSTCRFTASEGQGAETGTLSTIAFIHDPISNVNAAFCSVPDAAMEALHRGAAVNVSVTLVPMDKSAGQQNVVLPSMPVCVADGAGSRGKPPVYASLCCIIRNEARYLEEWIEYSRMIGVEHFYLYDHASTDSTRAVLSGYIDAGIVTLHQWEFPGYPQREAHAHCTHRYAHATSWLGLMDVDEFIVPVHHSTLVPLLTYFELEPVVLRLQAAMFGTSGHDVRPEGLVVENYVVRNLTSYWPINPQHKVWFRPGGNVAVLPSIHAVDVVAEGVTHLDIHENDAYYNHYRTKSREDHKDDPLRSRMAILEADEVVDMRVRDRFQEPLKARLRQCKAQGLCHLTASADSSKTPRDSASSSDDTSEMGSLGAVDGGWRGGEAVGGLIMAGPPVPATHLERMRSHFDECPQVAEAVLRSLPHMDTGPDSLIDLDPGTGYYVTHLHQRGYSVTGLDSDGELSDSLLDLDLREASAWRVGAAQEQEAKAKLPQGSVLLVQVPQPVPVGLKHVLDLVPKVCTGRFIIGWPAGVDWRRLEESLWLVHMQYNRQASKWLQEQAQLARQNVRMYRYNSNVHIKRCQGSAVYLVFDKVPMLEETTVNPVDAVKKDSASARKLEGLLWPPEGLVLPRLAILDVEWLVRARGSMTERQGQREREASASEDAMRDGAWDMAAVGDCALLLVDGVQMGRACGGAGTVGIAHASPGSHVVSVVPIKFLSQDDGVGDQNTPWVVDSDAAARSSRVWIEGPGHGSEAAAHGHESGTVGAPAERARVTDKVAVKVVGIRGASLTVRVSIPQDVVRMLSLEKKEEEKAALSSPPAYLSLMLSLSVGKKESPPLRYVLHVPPCDMRMSRINGKEELDADAQAVARVGEIDLTVFAAGSDVLGGDPLNVSVAGLWGQRGSICTDGGGCSLGRELLLEREEGVVLRGEGTALESMHTARAKSGAETDTVSGSAGERNRAQAGGREVGLGEGDYDAATEELFCRKVEIGLETLMPQWLAFLWSDEWGGGRDGANVRETAYWGRVGADDWAALPGGETLSSVLVSEVGDYLLGPLRVIDHDKTMWPGETAVVASFHVRSAGGEAKAEGASGGAGFGQAETMDWLVVRAVGKDAVVPGAVRRVAAGQYHVSLAIPRRACDTDGGECGKEGADTYVLQMVRAWKGLPVWLGGRDGEEIETCGAVLGHVGTQEDVVSELQQAASFIGHVAVPFISTPLIRGRIRGDVERIERPVCDSGGFWPAHGSKGGGGLRPGAWMRREFNGAAPRPSDLSEQTAPLGEEQDHAGAPAPEAKSSPTEAEDECHLVGGNWEWHPAECAQHRYSERDCEACWQSFQRVRFVGDSNCRDIYVEAATCVLGDWDPDLPVARQQTKHSNASVPLPSGGSLDFVWCTKLDQVAAGAGELLRELQGQSGGGKEGAGGAARGRVLVIGFGMWDIVVHLTPLSAMSAKLEPLFDTIAALRELGVAVVWLSPIPRTLMKRGILAGEKDVKVSYWRVRRWAHQLTRLMQGKGVAVVDSMHAAAALPEAFDGNHLGIACGWVNPGEWIGTHAGRPGVCRLNGRLLARNVLNILLGGLCTVPKRPRGHLVRVLPTMLEDSEADVTVKGLVRQLRFSVLDGGVHPTLRITTGSGVAQDGDGFDGGSEVSFGDSGNEMGREGVHTDSMLSPACPRIESRRDDIGDGLRFRWASRRTWPKVESGRWAVAEVRLRWCKLCRGLGRSEVQREEGAWELHHATVLLDDVPIASCGDAQCNLPIERLLPGMHTLTVTFFDPHDMLVSSSMYTIDVPLVDSMARNVALSEHGGRAQAKYNQGHFDVLRSIDGVEDGHDNGWAYHGQLADAEAMFVFSSSSRVRRVTLVSGAGRNDHHLTHVILAYSTASDPQLTDDDNWSALPIAADPSLSPEQVRVVEPGRVMMENGIVHVQLECDYIAATALKLIVLGTDAANDNAVVNEVAVWAV